MFQLDKVHTGSGRVEMDRLDSLNRCGKSLHAGNGDVNMIIGSGGDHYP